MTEHDEGNITPEETQAKVKKKRGRTKGRAQVEKDFKTLETLEVTYVSVDSIHPNSWNPNRQSEHDFELLCKSIEEDGFTQPGLCIPYEGKPGEYLIIDGEHRWRGAITLGYTEIPIVIVEMSEEQARISTVRHNRARGSHDIELEAELIRDLEKLGALDWAKDSLMLDEVELAKMLSDVPVPEFLSGEEFSEAWMPATLTDEEKELIKEGFEGGVEATELEDNKGKHTSAFTPAAIERQRDREKALEKAKTQQDIQQARNERKLHRVQLIFSDDEGELVKRVLGKQPAVKLLELCRKEMESDGV